MTNLPDGCTAEMLEKAFPPDPPDWMTIVQSICIYEMQEKGKEVCTRTDVLHWIVTEGDADTAEDFFKNHPYCISKWERFKEKDDVEALMNCIDELVEQCNKEYELI